MKATFMAAAVLASGAAAGHAGRHEHKNIFAKGLFERKSNGSETCVPGCTTIYTTITGPGGLYTPPATATPTTQVTTKPTSSPPATVPTPIAQTCPTPGVYTFPATTIVLTETTTVCGASTTKLPSGTHTVGGVTTVVTTATTVVCPVATTKTEGGVVTSVIETTTYVCPSAGTYTIAPITVTVTDVETVCPVPTVTSYTPGTYTQPATITTIVETSTVVYCPFTEVKPTSTPVVDTPNTPATTSSVPETPKNGGTTPIGGGKHWAITYTPYTPGGQCKGAAEVKTDIEAIARAGFTTVRVYSTDCDTLPNVGSACEANGLKIILGIFINEVGCENSSPHVSEQIAAIKAWGKWEIVELLVIANEAVFGGHCTVPQLKDLIVHVKTELGSAGYHGPCTTTDVVSSWLEQGMSELCSVIDVVACNAHAYFNGNVLPEAAGSFVAGQLALVEAVCNLPGYVMETGWPSVGKCINGGVSCGGAAAQETAILSIEAALGSKVVFFTSSDDAWKQPGDCGCERNFGCGKVFGIN